MTKSPQINPARSKSSSCFHSQSSDQIMHSFLLLFSPSTAPTPPHGHEAFGARVVGELILASREWPLLPPGRPWHVRAVGHPDEFAVTSLVDAMQIWCPSPQGQLLSISSKKPSFNLLNPSVCWGWFAESIYSFASSSFVVYPATSPATTHRPRRPLIWSRGDITGVAFVLASYLSLVLLFLCLQQFERAPANSPTKKRCKVGVWLSSTLLTAMFSWRVSALMPLAVAVVIWLMATSTVIGGFYALFICPVRD